MIIGEGFQNRQSKKKKVCLVPQFDRYPWLVKFVMTFWGRLLLVAVFTGLLYLFWPKWALFIGICLFFCVFFPGYRHIVLVLAAASSILIGRTYLQWDIINNVLAPSYGVSGPILTFPGALLTIGLTVLCCFLLVHFSRPDRNGVRIRRPILLVVTGYLFLLCLASYAPIHGYMRFGLWGFLFIFSKYIWYLCYSLSESNDPKSPKFFEQLGGYIPFWYVSILPYHRGMRNLNRIKATSPEELARCQLKGLKLLIWAGYLILLSLFYNTVCYGYAFDMTGLFSTYFDKANGTLAFYYDNKLFYYINSWPIYFDLPLYEDAFAKSAAGTPLLFHLNWLALVGHFFAKLIKMAFITHAGIAICRMAGYNALRNVYKPLHARTIAGFWNRYYFYFKEMLVNLFFYPTFFRYFKKRPALRLYLATAMAAGVGNFIYHLILEFGTIMEQGIWAGVVKIQPLIVYFILLVNGIFISQWRSLKAGPHRKGMPQPLPLLIVLGFYCILDVFTYIEGTGAKDNFRFLMALFNFGNG